MKKINPDVFDVFLEDFPTSNSTSGDRDDVNMNGVSPGLIMGVILKGITTYLLISIKYQKEHPEKWEIVRESIKKKYYIRLYNYLLLINLTKADNVSQCLSYGSTPVTEVLSHLLKAFEEWEYYENCAVIKQYIDCFTLSDPLT
jgi:hypothetical protein